VRQLGLEPTQLLTLCLGSLALGDIANAAGNQYPLLGFERAEADLYRSADSVISVNNAGR
jgi:hypothetical protein